MVTICSKRPDYTPGPRRSGRRNILALVECIRANLGKPEAEYLSRMSEVALENGNQAMALRFAGEAVEARLREASR